MDETEEQQWLNAEKMVSNAQTSINAPQMGIPWHQAERCCSSTASTAWPLPGLRKLELMHHGQELRHHGARVAVDEGGTSQ